MRRRSQGGVGPDLNCSALCCAISCVITTAPRMTQPVRRHAAEAASFLSPAQACNLTFPLCARSFPRPALPQLAGKASPSSAEWRSGASRHSRLGSAEPRKASNRPFGPNRRRGIARVPSSSMSARRTRVIRSFVRGSVEASLCRMAKRAHAPPPSACRLPDFMARFSKRRFGLARRKTGQIPAAYSHEFIDWQRHLQMRRVALTSPARQTHEYQPDQGT